MYSGFFCSGFMRADAGKNIKYYIATLPLIIEAEALKKSGTCVKDSSIKNRFTLY